MSSDHAPAAPHPGEVLAERLAERGLSTYRISEIMHIPYVRLHAVVKGDRRLTPDTALRLERALGVPAEYWLGCQMSYDLALAREAAGASLELIEPAGGSSGEARAAG